MLKEDLFIYIALDSVEAGWKRSLLRARELLLTVIGTGSGTGTMKVNISKGDL